MKYINTFTLKMIAVIAMLIDHIGGMFFPEVQILRIIGRLSFPIFCYTLVEGFLHTADVKKYLVRLGIFALISEVPFDLMVFGKIFTLQKQNVYWTLLIGLVMMCLLSKTNSIVIQFAIVVVLNLLCKYVRVDYAGFGLVLIFAFYIFRERKTERLFLAGLIFIALTSGMQLWGILALLLIACHNGEQGLKMKGFFYFFYPTHMLILYLISRLL